LKTHGKMSLYFEALEIRRERPVCPRVSGCDSFALAGQLPNTTFIGITGGGGYSNSLTDEQAEAAFLSSATHSPASEPVNVDAATAAANQVVVNSKNLVQNPDGTTQNIDAGETVQERKP